MHETLLQYIKERSTAPLTDRDAEVITKSFLPKHFRKRQYFLQEGEVCKYTAFLLKGSMRQYSVDEKGAEHIVRLAIENWWAGDRESFVMQTPSVYFIDAWEDTDALLISHADFVTIESIPAIKEMAKVLDERNAFAWQKRMNAFISLPAEKRYDDLAKTYPEFLRRFPQHIIGSYLGITKETLSRVRHQSGKK